MEQGGKRRWTWGLTAVTVGVALVAVALIIGMNRYGPSGQYSLSEANALCASVFGQAAQVTSVKAHANCASITSDEQRRGWLLILGIALIAGGAAWDFYVRRIRIAPGIQQPQ